MIKKKIEDFGNLVYWFWSMWKINGVLNWGWSVRIVWGVWMYDGDSLNENFFSIKIRVILVFMSVKFWLG